MTNGATNRLATTKTGGLSPDNLLRPNSLLTPDRNSTKANVITAGTIHGHANGVSTKASTFSVIILSRGLDRIRHSVSLIAAPSKTPITVIRAGGYSSSVGT